MSTGESEDRSPQNVAFQSRPWLVRLLEDFKRGVDDGRQVALLPEVVMTIGVDRENAAAAGAVGDLLGRAIAAGIHTLLSDSPAIRAEKERIAKARLDDLERSPQTHSWLLWIRQAALVRAWASLEAFAEDMWVETLNRAGRKLRQGAFSSILKSKDPANSNNLSDMQVKVNFLAKYDFNIQDKIGTILTEKFSFKTVDGIGRAYRAAFGWRAESTCPAFPDPIALQKVEWKRHAIVHRGGHIDEEYSNKSGSEGSLIGKPLELSTETVVDDINQIIAQGGNLLGQLACWLEAIEPASQDPSARAG